MWVDTTTWKDWRYDLRRFWISCPSIEVLSRTLLFVRSKEKARWRHRARERDTGTLVLYWLTSTRVSNSHFFVKEDHNYKEQCHNPGNSNLRKKTQRKRYRPQTRHHQQHSSFHVAMRHKRCTTSASPVPLFQTSREWFALLSSSSIECSRRRDSKSKNQFLSSNDNGDLST